MFKRQLAKSIFLLLPPYSLKNIIFIVCVHGLPPYFKPAFIFTKIFAQSFRNISQIMPLLC